MGVVPPEPGFNDGLAAICAPSTARCSISDEVMTGFRVLAGRAGTASRAVVGPDLFTFGKVMGGGFPAAAFGGRADVMATLAPAGPGLPGRHAVREPVATAAGLATLRGCDRRGLRRASTRPRPSRPSRVARR